ncbi:penicillin-insensitive murein endopeptidase [Elusimicrobiota bacterium]
MSTYFAALLVLVTAPAFCFQGSDESNFVNAVFNLNMPISAFNVPGNMIPVPLNSGNVTDERVHITPAVADGPMTLLDPSVRVQKKLKYGNFGADAVYVNYTSGATLEPFKDLEARSASEAIGYYNNKTGRLKNSIKLPEEGMGFVSLKRSNNKNKKYGTEEIVFAMETLGMYFSEEFPDSARLEIGDLSLSKGGKAGGHNSHRNGLDVDISMLDASNEETNNVDKYSKVSETFIKNYVSRGNVTKSFDIKKNWALMRLTVVYTPVQRIYVDKAVKKTFCKVYGGTRIGQAVLRYLQPWDAHGDHHHVRLECPSGDKRCVRPNPPPRTDRCWEDVRVKTPNLDSI